MKNLTFIFILLSSIAFSQTKVSSQIIHDPDENSYELVYHIDSLTVDQMYLAGRNHIIKMFNDANEVIQMDDRESASLFARGSFVVLWMEEMNTWFSLDFQVKEGRIRIFIDDLYFKWYVSGRGLQEQSVAAFCKKRKGNLGQSACQQVTINVYAMMEEIVDAIEKAKEPSSW